MSNINIISTLAINEFFVSYYNKGYLPVSVLTGRNINFLKNEISKMLLNLQDFLILTKK
jgi:hypothetical protein